MCIFGQYNNQYPHILEFHIYWVAGKEYCKAEFRCYRSAVWYNGRDCVWVCVVFNLQVRILFGNSVQNHTVCHFPPWVDVLVRKWKWAVYWVSDRADCLGYGHDNRVRAWKLQRRLATSTTLTIEQLLYCRLGIVLYFTIHPNPHINHAHLIANGYCQHHHQNKLLSGLFERSLLA